MDPEQIKDMRDYAWKYFSLHADQRIKTFNFFLVVASFAVAGMLSALKDATYLWAVSPIAFLLAFLSFIFWKLDGRNKQLVRHGEAALKFLESQSGLPDEGAVPHVLKIFTFEEHSASGYKRYPQAEWPDAHMSYSDCFNAVFLIFGVMSFVSGIASLVVHFGR